MMPMGQEVVIVTKLPRFLLTVFLLLVTSGGAAIVWGNECGDPPSIGNAVSKVTHNVTSNSTSVLYRCLSGFKLRSSGYISASCNATGLWNLGEDSAGWDDCTKFYRYEGCKVLDAASLTQISVAFKTTPPDNNNECSDQCVDRGFFYMARQGDSCYCFMSLTSLASTNLQDIQCNQPCYDSMSYCGSSSLNAFSVYTTLYSTVSIEDRQTLGTPFLPVRTEKTCVQLCKGSGTALYFYKEEDTACYCMDTPPAYKVIWSSYTKTNNTGSLGITDVSGTQGATCLDLFAKGIFYHGYYILDGGTNASCVFYDNSAACDHDWVAYTKGCYHFSDAIENATWHFDHCRSHDSLLASVGDAEEMEFLNIATKGMSHIPNSPGFYLSLYDTTSLFSYMWADETQVVYRPFDQGYPNDIRHACITKPPTLQKLRNGLCTQPMSGVCEKRSSTPGCAQQLSGSLGDPVVVSDLQVSPLCFESCRSLNKSLSLTHNTSCYCYDDLSDFQLVSWDQCDIPCSSHPFQMCGGSSGLYFMTRDQGQEYRDDCDLMILQGMVTNVTIRDPDGTGTQVLRCKERAGELCPLSWLEINRKCYRFFPESNSLASLTCHTMGGYLSVFETDHEKSGVIDILSHIPSLSASNQTWATGLYVYRPLSSKARHTNGAWVNVSQQSFASTAKSKCSVFKFPSGDQVPEGGECGQNPFICEKGSDFVGCYSTSTDETEAAIITDYPEMTVRLCIEACKPMGKPYAGLFGSQTCLCVANLGKLDDWKCDEMCASLQSCGSRSNDYISVYKIDYTFNATTCRDLFDQGVLLNGRYTLGSGVDTWCGMKDSDFLSTYALVCSNTSSCDYTRHMFGVGDDVFSFDVIPSAVTTSAKSQCSDIFEPATIVASVQNSSVRALITEVMQWSLDADQSVPTLVGAADPFEMGVFTWANGDLFRDSDLDLSSEEGQSYLTMKYNGNLTSAADDATVYHVTCTRDLTYLGCQKGLNMTALSSVAQVTNYQSVSTVLCRQVCQAAGTSHFLMSTESCVCVDPNSMDPDLSLTSLIIPANNTRCDVACPSHPFQKSAKPPFFRYHQIMFQDTAESCEELYSNFVVYNSTYIVNGTKTRCGLDDAAVSCPPGFISQNNTCYAFRNRKTGHSDAVDSCLYDSAYLAAPTTEADHDTISNLIRQFSHIGAHDVWRVGYIEHSQKGYLSSSLGFMLHTNNTLSTTDSNHCVGLNVVSRKLVSVKCTEKLPFVCASSDLVLGCAEVSEGNVTASILLNGGMTIQQCVSYCYGLDLNATMVALSGGMCSCLDSREKISAWRGTCVHTCPGQDNQGCGKTWAEDKQLSTVYNIAGLTREYLHYSCDDLFAFGVVLPHQYYVKTDDGFDYVTCFKYSPMSDYILANHPSFTIDTSESSDQFSPSMARFDVHSLDTAGWKGQAVNHSFVYIDLHNLYVLEGVILHDPDPTLQQTIQLSVSVDGIYFMESDVITLPASIVPLWHYLPLPMVARHVNMSFIASAAPRLSLEIVGYPYASHDFNDVYMGCHVLPNISSQTPVFDGGSFQECRTKCQDEKFPLMVLYYPDSCQCLDTPDTRDLYEVNHCNMTCWNMTCTAAGGHQYVALYTTTDFTCVNIHVNNSHVTDYVVKNASIDDVTVATSKFVKCDKGFEIQNDTVTSVNMTCHNKGVWNPEAGLQCVRVDCGYPPTHPNTNVTTTNYGTLYGDSLNYSCVQDGFIFNGDQEVWTVTCHEDKDWKPDVAAQCSRIKCDAPPTVLLATPNTHGKTTFVFGDIVTYTCIDGARFDSNMEESKNSTCLSDGTWYQIDPNCTRYRCPISHPEVGNAHLTLHDPHHVEYTCLFDHFFSDRSTTHHLQCDSDTFMWSSPTDNICSLMETHSSMWSLNMEGYRLTAAPLSSHTVRSVTDCALACLSDSDCYKFSHSTNENVATNCVISTDGRTSISQHTDGQSDSTWGTYTMGGTS